MKRHFKASSELVNPETRIIASQNHFLKQVLNNNLLNEEKPKSTALLFAWIFPSTCLSLHTLVSPQIWKLSTYKLQ